MFFEINEDGKIMICSEERFRDTAAELAPPSDFVPEEMHDWKVVDGVFVHDPLPEKDTPRNDMKARIAALEEQIDMLLSGVTADE